MTVFKILASLVLGLISAGFASGAFSYFAYGGIQGSFVSIGITTILFCAGIIAPILVTIQLWKVK